MVFIINTRVFKSISILLLFTSFVQSIPSSLLRAEHRISDDDIELPLENPKTTTITQELVTTPSSEPSFTPIIGSSNEDTYDQRQNGTENYRVHLDGLVVVVAPVEALLFAGDLPNIIHQNTSDGKPDVETKFNFLKPGNSAKKSLARSPQFKLLNTLFQRAMASLKNNKM